MHSVIIPGRPRLEDTSRLSREQRAVEAQTIRMLDLLVGRDPSSLTPTEDRIAEWLGLHGETYIGEWARTPDCLLIRTPEGPDPNAWISTRLPRDTPISDACWILADVAAFWLDTPELHTT